MFFQKNQSEVKVMLTLIIGIVLGYSLAQLLQNSKCSLNITLPLRSANDDHDEDYANHHVKEFAPDESPEQFKFSKYTPKNDDTSMADRLYNETRVLCWILTSPANHEKKATHVKNTWGSRCNKLIFMSSEENQALGAIELDVGEGRSNLWRKTREAAKYIYENHFDDADWFLKADDDTYVVVENLRAFLYPYSTEAPVYFGCKFKQHVRKGYMSGGAGYVLSKEALRRFVEKAYPNNKICRKRTGGSEDKEMGYCLQNVGVVAGDSRDELKRGRFFPSGPGSHLIPKQPSHWYWRYIYYATDDGIDCCSNYAISFHYINPSFLYVMDYLIYRLRAFGILQSANELPPKQNMTALLDKWSNEKSDNPLQ